MIGLEYLCNINNIEFKDLASELGLGKSTVSNWIAGRRKISEKYYEKLKEVFKVPEEYFQKELDELDKLQLQRIKLENDAVEYTYLDTVWDDYSQEYIEIEKTACSIPHEHMEILDLDIQKKELFKNIDSLIAEKVENVESEWEYIGNMSEILELFEIFYDIIKKEVIPYRRIKDVLNSIKVAKDKRFESHIFIRKLSNVIRQQMLLDEKALKENIRAAREIIEMGYCDDEDWIEEYRWNNKILIDKIEKIVKEIEQLDELIMYSDDTKKNNVFVKDLYKERRMKIQLLKNNCDLIGCDYEEYYKSPKKINNKDII